jgi:GNAT superfamily N-acetyltransferase
MGVFLDELRQPDIARLAKLHVTTLPRSMVSRLGLSYARSFYRYLARSLQELIFLERDREGSIMGACVLSLAPDSLERRLLFGTFLWTRALFNFRKMPWSELLSKAAPQASVELAGEKPELLIIFADPAHQSMGIGTRLVALCERALLIRSVRSYRVKTENRNDNRALQFYDRNGFARIANITVHGIDFVLFEKSLLDRSERDAKGTP